MIHAPPPKADKKDALPRRGHGLDNAVARIRSAGVPSIMFKRNKMSSHCLCPEQDQTMEWRCRLKYMRTRCEKPRAIVRDSVKCTRDVFAGGNDFIGCGNYYFELAPTRIGG